MMDLKSVNEICAALSFMRVEAGWRDGFVSSGSFNAFLLRVKRAPCTLDSFSLRLL
jgi:hypothetical protein